MNAQLSRLRRLVLKDLDPVYFRIEAQQAENWMKEMRSLAVGITAALQEEVLGDLSSALVERHLKQLQYDCIFLLNALYKFDNVPDAAQMCYQVTESSLQYILTEIDLRYAGGFKLQPDRVTAPEDYRIRVLLSVDGLAYFFKLLNKAGALDAGPIARLVVALSKNFSTSRVGHGQLSSHSIMTKYKQVVQTTARSVKTLLLKMLKLLDEEFSTI